jgi:hypothetical protein
MTVEHDQNIDKSDTLDIQINKLQKELEQCRNFSKNLFLRLDKEKIADRQKHLTSALTGLLEGLLKNQNLSERKEDLNELIANFTEELSKEAYVLFFGVGRLLGNIKEILKRKDSSEQQKTDHLK